MNPWVTIRHPKPGRFRVGDQVRIVIGYPGATATILEDHGPLGPGGQRFYTIHMKRPGAEDIQIDYPEDEMAPFEPDPADDTKAP